MSKLMQKIRTTYTKNKRLLAILGSIVFLIVFFLYNNQNNEQEQQIGNATPTPATKIIDNSQTVPVTGNDTEAYFINQIVSNPRFTFIKARVTSIDTKKKIVHTDTCSRSYDVLVLATGSSANYFGTPGALEHTIALRDLSSAYKIRNKIIAQIERADVEENPKKRSQLLTFMIVGAGATGVEVAGELAQFIRTILSSDHRRIDPKEVTILLVHRNKEILNMLPSYYSQKCAAELLKLGVTLVLEREIKKVGEGYVVDQHHKKIEVGTIFWAVGFTPNTLPLDGKKHSVYQVNPSLQVVDERGNVHKNIFALGDILGWRHRRNIASGGRACYARVIYR